MTDIDTPEALDALPVGSVVLDREGDVWRRMDDGVWLPLSVPDWPTPPLAAFLPATALHPDRPSDLATEVERLRRWTFDDLDTPPDAEFVALADLRALLAGREAAASTPPRRPDGFDGREAGR